MKRDLYAGRLAHVNCPTCQFAVPVPVREILLLGRVTECPKCGSDVALNTFSVTRVNSR